MPSLARVSPVTADAPPAARHGWLRALLTVLSGLAAMFVLAALGLWAAGASHLPDGAFARVVVATVVTAVGGTLDLTGDAGPLARTRAGLTVMPLSVTLAGALLIGAGFLRPLRHRAVASARELAGWAARLAVLWLLALIGLGLAARQTFAVNVGNGVLSDLTDLFGGAPTIGFAANVPLTVLFGLLWLAGVLLLALLAAPGAPLPARLLRLSGPVRPAAHAMILLLLGYVAVALVVALVSAATRGHPAETFAVILLGLPNLAWLALTLGQGATWHGRVDGPFGLPMPPVLDHVLRTPDISTLNLRTLTEYDSGMWWLLVAQVVLTSAVAVVMAARCPPGVRAWQHAVRLAVALALTVLTVCLLCRISAHYGLSLLGIGDLGGGLSGELLLRPRLWQAVGLGALWGLVLGFLGALPTRRTLRRGRVDTPGEPAGPSASPGPGPP